jgi:hypothetical protein
MTDRTTICHVLSPKLDDPRLVPQRHARTCQFSPAQPEKAKIKRNDTKPASANDTADRSALAPVWTAGAIVDDPLCPAPDSAAKVQPAEPQMIVAEPPGKGLKALLTL